MNDSDAENVVETVFDEDEAKEILSTLIKERSKIKKTFLLPRRRRRSEIWQGASEVVEKEHYVLALTKSV